MRERTIFPWGIATRRPDSASAMQSRPGGPGAPARAFWTLTEAATYLGIPPAAVQREAHVRGMRLLSLGSFPNAGYRIRATDIGEIEADLALRAAMRA